LKNSHYARSGLHTNIGNALVIQNCCHAAIDWAEMRKPTFRHYGVEPLFAFVDIAQGLNPANALKSGKVFGSKILAVSNFKKFDSIKHLEAADAHPLGNASGALITHGHLRRVAGSQEDRDPAKGRLGLHVVDQAKPLIAR